MVAPLAYWLAALETSQPLLEAPGGALDSDVAKVALSLDPTRHGG